MEGVGMGGEAKHGVGYDSRVDMSYQVSARVRHERYMRLIADLDSSSGRYRG